MSYEIHGDTGTRLHRIWKGMKARCNTPSYKPYKWYGANGITVCKEWNDSYCAFKKWSLEHGYSSTLELDRIDVHKGYCPENCRWITHKDNTINRRDSLKFSTPDGAFNSKDFCEFYHINYHTLVGYRHNGTLMNFCKKRGIEVKIEGGKANPKF